MSAPLRWLVAITFILSTACATDDRGPGPWMPPGASGADGEDTGATSLGEGTTGGFLTDGHGADGGGFDTGDDGPRPDLGGHTTGDGNGTGAGDDGGPPPPDCPANCYCEPIDPDADIDDLEAAYQPSAWAQTMFDVLGRRWPAGGDLLVAEQDDPYFGSFSDTSSFAGLMDSLMTEVHEGTHGWDYGHAGVSDFAYYLRDDLTYHPPKIDGFPRSEIYGMVQGDATDLYAGTYLTGTQGTYGWYELLDEMNCYINGMGAIAVVGEYIPWGISGRDGAVAFIYYLELYLQRARTTYPQLYEQLKGESEYVDLVRTQWLRTHFLLQYADEHSHIGIEDAAIRQLMYQPENQAEIEMFIDHELEASNCLP